MHARTMLVALALATGVFLRGVDAPVRADDVDGDGVDNAFDVCSATPAGTAVDAAGRPLGDVDKDCDTDLDDHSLFQRGLTGPGPFAPPGMVAIPGGQFAMGCHAKTGENCDSIKLPVHNVNLDSFFLDIFEVTKQQYTAYLISAYAKGQIEVVSGIVYKAGDSEAYCDTYTSDPDSRIRWNGEIFIVKPDGVDHPMIDVSWYGAVAYANWLSNEHRRTPCYNLDTWACDLAANGYRLPTEAEWEYAGRGGEHDPYYAYPWGNTIEGSKANFRDSGDAFETGVFAFTTPVGYYDGGQLPPGVEMANGYGLYDMAGNAWEWCNDWYDSDYYDRSPSDNPTGPGSGTHRVLRGGSWVNSVGLLRCAIRNWDGPGARGTSKGFRLAAGN